MVRILLCSSEHWEMGTPQSFLKILSSLKIDFESYLPGTKSWRVTYFLSLKLLYLIFQKVLHITSAPLKWSFSSSLHVGKEMTLRPREFVKLTRVFGANTINRDEQQRTSVKLSFSKQQKLEQICFLSSTMETNTDSPKSFPVKGSLWTVMRLKMSEPQWLADSPVNLGNPVSLSLRTRVSVIFLGV